ncbi:MAG: hypothetical protein M3R06_04975 [Chloroflexota bacterium]|nr:hypothetical protein [Chloroflexota bacterium]
MVSGRATRPSANTPQPNRRELLIGVLVVLILIAIGIYLGVRGDTPEPPPGVVIDAVTEAPRDTDGGMAMTPTPMLESASPVEISDEPGT